MNHIIRFLSRKLPAGLEMLVDPATDVRWTRSHAGDALRRGSRGAR
jgi:hypothetical protein